MFSLFTKCFSNKKSSITIINPNRLKGKIYIGFCRGHETIIFIIRLNGYKDQHKKPIPIKFRMCM